jgi:hypothetical protein
MRVLPIALLLGSGCVADTYPLGPGWFEEAEIDDSPATECRYSGPAVVDALFMSRPNFPTGLVGPATLNTIDPIAVTFRTGEQYSVAHQVFGLADRLSPGQEVHVTVFAYKPSWTETQLFLSELVGRDRSGALLAALWSTSIELRPPAGLFEMIYEPDDCLPSATLEGCGDAVTMTLVVRPRPDAIVRIPSGQVREVEGFLIGNGRSHFYPEGSACDDRPDEWREGFVLRP